MSHLHTRNKSFAAYLTEQYLYGGAAALIEEDVKPSGESGRIHRASSPYQPRLENASVARQSPSVNPTCVALCLEAPTPSTPGQRRYPLQHVPAP